MTVDEFIGGCQQLLRARGTGGQAYRSYYDGSLRVAWDTLNYKFNIYENTKSSTNFGRCLVAISAQTYTFRIEESEFAATCGHLAKHLDDLLILDRLAEAAP